MISVSDFIPNYHIISPSIGNSIYAKKEFYDRRLDSQESVPENSGDLLQAQVIVARYLSARTPYNELLINWELGTGKTCASIGAVETIRREASGIYKNAFIFAKGVTVLDNIKNEIIHRCTSGQYIPENYDMLSPLERTFRENKLLGEFYRFNTFEMFAKKIMSMTDAQIVEEYSNIIVVIDEVHNIRLQDVQNARAKVKVRVYDSFHRFLHLIQSRKIILMSGTPMKDGVDEIASVMNLILPQTEQLPQSSKEFLIEYFVDDDGIKYTRPDKVMALKNAFHGRVSYLSAQQSIVRKTFIGERLGSLRYFNVVPCLMSDFQTTNYVDAYNTDMGRGGDDDNDEETIDGVDSTADSVRHFFSNSKQASLFVFPDGESGSKGFLNPKYVRTSNILNTQVMSHALGEGLRRDLLSGSSTERKLEALQKYSCKYSLTIENILNGCDDGKSSFVYSDLVAGSGGILFSLLLGHFGFTKYSGKDTGEKELSSTRRYAIINSEMSTAREIENILKRFNGPSNMHGEKIAVIIGSRKISEGISLKNVQMVHVLTPHWNYSETTQAIGRGYRFGSHQNLIDTGVMPTFDVYQYVAVANIPEAPLSNRSVDLRLYEISEKKDVSIKAVEQLMKEAAMDCAINYNRNHKSEISNNQRDCNYGACDYFCDFVDSGEYGRPLEPIEVDLSSYRVYYNSDTIYEIVRGLEEVFSSAFVVSYEKLAVEFNTYLEFDLMASLSMIVRTNRVIKNKYGLPAYLRETYAGGEFYLVDSVSTPSQSTTLDNYYSRVPIVETDSTYPQVLSVMYAEKTPSMVEDMFMKTSKDDVLLILNKFPSELVEFILEASVQSKYSGVMESSFQRDVILENLKHALIEIDSGRLIISNLVYRETNVLRCFNIALKTWDDCTSDEAELYIKTTAEQADILNSNEYYGTFNGEKFCIVKTSLNQDKRRENKGMVCSSWKKPVLIHLATNILNMRPHTFNNTSLQTRYNKLQLKIKDRTWLEKQVLENKFIKVCVYVENEKQWEMNDITSDDIKDINNDDMMALIFFSMMTTQQLCGEIRGWFASNNLLTYDENCGTARKKMVVG